ncbi:MAG: family transcriptional regulator [Streptosporangiaceae bacterium]|nr:family transcriptional regulator [Streptosporangiaceae bacterium]
MSEISTIGARLKAIRRERNMTQEGLAAAADVSRDVIAKLEQGRRQWARAETLMKLANALDVDLSDFTGKRDRIGSDRDGGRVLALRNALISPTMLPDIDDQSGAEPVSVEDLHRSVAAAVATYWRGDFGALLATLPGLITDARRTHASAGTSATQSLALAYDLGANLMVHLGRDDLAAIGAERAIITAHGGDDELLWATLHATYSWVMLHQARLEEAEQLAANMAARVEPSFSGDARRVAVWGNLLMTALAPAAAAKRDIAEYISLAGAGAERLGRRVNIYHTAFGPASVAMQATHAHATMGKPDRALESARKLHPGDLKGISQGAHLLDVAQAHVDAKHRRAAVERLQEARDVSPVWFRHQGIARSLVRDIREEETRPSPAIRSLAQTLAL